MKNQTLRIFRPLFEKQLRLLKNQSCAKCDAKIKHPLLPWLVGSDYWRTEERLLFVGKPHRGKPGDILRSGLIDPTNEVEGLVKKHWPYWKYTKEIAERIFGSSDNLWDKVAFTNIIKCTNVRANKDSGTADRTSHVMAQCCIGDLKVVFHEIRRLEPRTIIFYTFSLYRELLRELPSEWALKSVDVTSENKKVRCGKKQLHWWERSVVTTWHDHVRVLVVGHPERMAKKEYVELLANWINRKTTGNLSSKKLSRRKLR